MTLCIEVNGSRLAYGEADAGDPILFLHGNPTSKYLWRNIMPWMERHGRVIAPDLIGMGEELIFNQNMFVEQVLPSSMIRGLTEVEMGHNRVPDTDPASRLPTLVWPRQIPIDGEPADVIERVTAYNEWSAASTLPKLHVYVSPGAISPPEVVDYLSQTLTNYESVYVGQGLHLIQEDHLEAIGRAIGDWYRRNGQ